jgi:hypothetical protein
MPFVIVSTALNLSESQLQFWLGAIQSLDLRLLVNGQNRGIIRKRR